MKKLNQLRIPHSGAFKRSPLLEKCWINCINMLQSYNVDNKVPDDILKNISDNKVLMIFQ